MARVLIVEDEPAIARLLYLCISLGGHHVAVASTLDEAWARTEEKWPDIVTLDLRLGNEDGAGLIERARRQDCGCRFVILSAADAREAARTLGADDWIAKPFDPWVVMQKIDELANGDPFGPKPRGRRNQLEDG